ncbi:replication initiation protein [Rhizobium sp. KVB221]|uniref:Replication initiation protein n=1 Tax=Rhizobium setariae TaxID=2801340 RepID=A0A937CND7_9HYPH|nr:replication initiation protein [Rhizobium setariae]MBL0375380.1 replication initiation protein [Rhizobium setariae]
MNRAEGGPAIWGIQTRGADRFGIRASDLVREARYDNLITSPRFEYANVLISSGRYVEHDELTAQDQAIYYYLIARMRDHVNALNRADTAIEKRSALWNRGLSIEISVRDLVSYTGTASLVRIRASLERIAKTRLCYDLRRPLERDLSPKSLIEFSSIPDRLTSGTVIRYAIDRAIRSTMARARRYVLVDLNAFSRFRCRYAPRLYLRLAMLATYDRDRRKSWTPDIAELADALGYPTKAFHRANFIATIDRALQEIRNLPEINRRFAIAAAMPSADDIRFRFATSGTRKTLYDVRRRLLPRDALRHAEARGWEIGLREHQYINASHIGHAAAFTGEPPMDLSNAWRYDIIAANNNPRHPIGSMPGAEFLALIDRFGAPAAFEHWLGLKGYGSILDVDDYIPSIEPPDDLFAGLNYHEINDLLDQVDNELHEKLPPRVQDEDEDVFSGLLNAI